MPKSIRTTLSVVMTIGIVVAATHVLAATPAQKCQAGKNRAAGKYAACRHSAEAKLASSGNLLGYALAMGKCATKFSATWVRLEAHAGGACPSNGDAVSIGNVVDEYTSNIATAVAGGPLVDCSSDLAQCSDDLASCLADLGGCPGDLATCESDLVTCQAEPRGQRLSTGQTTCSNSAGTVIPCVGTGQDGDFQFGLAASYTDNGDGTITDNRTGLEWEKLSDDGSIHDKDTTYSWSNAFSLKIATLNGGGFAGHSDWRLPNILELESLRNFGTFNPSIHAVFNTGCTLGCSVTSCSCTRADGYWTSTTQQNDLSDAWVLGFGAGGAVGHPKTDVYSVRAVRGGS